MRKVFTPLESSAIYGGDDINPVRKSFSNGVKGPERRLNNQRSPSFLTRFTVYLLICCITFFSISTIYAETLKIGVFDLQRVMKESKVVQGYRQKLGKEIESKKKILAEKEESTKQIEEKLKKEGQKLSSSERKALEEKLTSQAKELKRMREDINLDLQKMDRELTQQALKDIEGIIKKIANDENYSIIFERNAAGIVHLKDSVDITGKIITIYDKR